MPTEKAFDFALIKVMEGHLETLQKLYRWCLYKWSFL